MKRMKETHQQIEVEQKVAENAKTIAKQSDKNQKIHLTPLRSSRTSVKYSLGALELL